VENLLKMLKQWKTQENRACRGQTFPKLATLRIAIFEKVTISLKLQKRLDKNKKKRKIRIVKKLKAPLETDGSKEYREDRKRIKHIEKGTSY
jgi:cell division FtsZ-interacting protein ZapD